MSEVSDWIYRRWFPGEKILVENHGDWTFWNQRVWVVGPERDPYDRWWEHETVLPMTTAFYIPGTESHLP